MKARALAVAALVIGGAIAAPAPAQAHWTGWTHEHVDNLGTWRTCGWLDFFCRTGYTTPIRPIVINGPIGPR
jgi:hypothetical protein